MMTIDDMYIQAEGSVSESEGTWNNLALISDSAQTSTYKKVRSREVKVIENKTTIKEIGEKRLVTEIFWK